MKDEQTPKQSDTIHVVSKLTIAVPLVIMVLALLISINSRSQSMIKKTSIQPTLKVESQTSQTASAASTISFDLKGPLNCEYKSSTQDIRVAVKDTKVATTIIENKQQRHIIRSGDCVYLWNHGELTGQKICGVEQYASMFQMVSSLPFFKPEMLASMLNQFNTQPGASIAAQLPFAEVLKKCKKSAVNEGVFDIPTAVNFVLATPTQTTIQP